MQEPPCTASSTRTSRPLSHSARGPPGKPHQHTKQQPQQLDLANKPLAAPPDLASYPLLSKLNLLSTSITSITRVSTAANTLTWLNVSGNDLSSPAAWNGIDQLKTLFVLNVSHCHLTEVPPCVAKLAALKALVVSHNSLTKLSHVANLADLNTIVVSNNALTALPSSLSTLPSLKKISAAHNQLTPSGLPDLSALSHLHELRLNDNPGLTLLPAHFGSWGKAPLPLASSSSSAVGEKEKERGDGDKRAKARQGLEILDLGNCGVASWFGLKELASQTGIVNLGLKGNPVAEEAVRESGIDALQAKLTVLLPSLRILDNRRFDAKHADLKLRRAARSAAQRVLDAGPMGLALNAAAAAPVEISKDDLRDAERERENRKRKKLGLKEISREEEEERKRVKAEKRARREAARAAEVAGGADEEEASEGGAAPKRPKRAREADAAPAPAPVVAEDDAPAPAAAEPKKKKRKQRRAEEEAAQAAQAATPSEAAASAEAAAPATAAGEVATPAAPEEKKKDKKPKKKGAKAGVLDALRGDDSTSAPSPSSVQHKPAPAPAAAPEQPKEQPKDKEKEKEKEKTSVARIVEVKPSSSSAGAGGKKGGKKGAAAREREEKKRKEDVGALLGLGLGGATGVRVGDGEGAAAAEKAKAKEGTKESPFAALTAPAKGTGLFGGGGWD
ncbi:hypothetical protein JCM10207_008093 [Rhodosporidiobolus poonsookiae]